MRRRMRKRFVESLVANKCRLDVLKRSAAAAVVAQIVSLSPLPRDAASTLNLHHCLFPDFIHSNIICKHCKMV